MVTKKINSVFLIDDDHITNFINARLLNRLKVSDTLMISQNGQDALDTLQECLDKGMESPSLIFLDINMPVMDGFEFIEHFTRMPFPNKEEVKIYMLTTSENGRDLDKVKVNPSISGFINKPLTEDKVRKIIQRHFE